MPGIFDVILGPVADIVKTVVEREIPDKAKSQEIADEVSKEIALSSIQGELAQLDINKVEAGNSSLFVAGWRPFIGWVCGSALAYEYVIAPVGMWLAGIVGHPIPPPPMLDEVLWQLMFGMLGMGTLRTYEKMKGVATTGLTK